MLAAPWDLSFSSSSCFFFSSIIGLLRSKVSQMVLQGHKLSSNPFAFYSSLQHCVLFNWLWTCWCASSSCSADARPYKWVWGEKRTSHELANSHACQGAAFRVTVEWWTADETTTAVRWSSHPASSWGVFAPSLNFVLSSSQAHKTCFVFSF